MPVLDPYKGFQDAIPHWDPGKHPRDRLGQFLEVGDLVNAFSGPGVPEPEASGLVTASYFDKPTGRIFIGVTYAGYTKWYRPKQLEHIDKKATIANPELPIPSVDDKYDEVFWTGDIVPKPDPMLINDALDKGIGGKLFTLQKSELPLDMLSDLGLVTPKESSAEPQQPNSSPPVASGEHDKILKLISSSFYNKKLDATYPGGGSAWEQDFQAMLDEKELGKALVRLAKLMTAAKLGGKQRARYKSVLVQKHGGSQSMGMATPGADPSGVTTGGKIDPKNAGTWREFAPHIAGSMGVMSMAKGNSVIEDGLYHTGPIEAGKAKAQIQIEIADRLDKMGVTDAQMADFFNEGKNAGYNVGASYRSLHDAYVNPNSYKPSQYELNKSDTGAWSVVPLGHGGFNMATKAPLNPKNLRRALLESVSNQLVSNWAASSNDSNPRSLALQVAAEREFGLKDTYEWQTDVINTETQLKHHEDLMRKFLRAQYENTQAWAKKHNVKYVRLRRGSDVHVGQVNSVVEVKLRPMSSFTSNMPTATGFGHKVIEAVVPVEWLIGTARSGYGCLNEYEWVILGGTHKVKVIT